MSSQWERDTTLPDPSAPAPSFQPCYDRSQEGWRNTNPLVGKMTGEYTPNGK